MSTAPYWIDAFIDSLQRRADLAGVEVFPVMVSDASLSANKDSIRISSVSHNEQAAELGRGRRDESYDVEVVLRASVPGGGPAVALQARNAAYALLRKIQDELRTNPRYDLADGAEGRITYAEVVGAEYSAAVQTNDRSATIDTSIRVLARYP